MERLGRIGETPAGVLTRLALSDGDRRGRDLLVGWMLREAGLIVTWTGWAISSASARGGRAGSLRT